MTEYHFEINGSSYRVKIVETRAGQAIVEVNGTEYRVDIKTPASPASPSTPSVSTSAPLPVASTVASARSEVTAEDGIVQAPLSGVIRKVMAKPGDVVEAGDPILMLEAMKMENEIKASVAGTVAELFVAVGDSVNTGDNLFRITQ
mgnify:CR=1 FL=1